MGGGEKSKGGTGDWKWRVAAKTRCGSIPAAAHQVYDSGGQGGKGHRAGVKLNEVTKNRAMAQVYHQ